jgi:hypothetical protein
MLPAHPRPEASDLHRGHPQLWHRTDPPTAAAEPPVIKGEQPTHTTRRSEGNPDPINAHPAVLTTQQRNTERLPTPRPDGDPCASRCAPTTTRPLQPPSKPTGCAHCCATGTTPTAPWPTLTPATPFSPGWPGATNPARPAASKPYTPARSTDSPRRYTKPPALTANHNQLHAIINNLGPRLTNQPSIGPVSATQTILPLPHPSHRPTDTTFATLARTNPINTSSNQTTHHRPTPSRDPALNRAIHTTTQKRSNPHTHASLLRRRAQRKTNRQIRHYLKRDIARQPYRTLTTAITPDTTASARTPTTPTHT